MTLSINGQAALVDFLTVVPPCEESGGGGDGECQKRIVLMLDVFFGFSCPTELLPGNQTKEELQVSSEAVISRQNAMVGATRPR